MSEILAELVARITADTADLKKGLSQSEKDIKGLGKTIDKETKSIKESFLEVDKAAGLMGAAITASMGAMIMSFGKVGSELNDLSLKTGVSVETLAGLKYAAEQNGASLGTVEMAIRRTAMAMTDANDGLAETKRAFDRMGLSLQSLEGLNPEQQFLKIASAIADIPDPMMRAATAQDLFGRSGMDMLPMLAQGADGLKKLMTEGQKLSGWTTEGSKKADAFGDALDTLKTAIGGTTNAIASSLAPALTDLAGMFTGLNTRVADLIKSQPELARALGGGALAAGVLATAIGGVAIAVALLGAAFLPVLIAVTTVGLLTAAGIALYDTFKKTDKAILDAANSTKELTKAWEAEQAQIKATAKRVYESALKEADKFGNEVIKALQKKNQAEEKAELAKNQNLIDDNRDKTDSLIKNLEEETSVAINEQRKQLDATELSISNQMSAERKRHSTVIENLTIESDARLKALDKQTKGLLSGVDAQIQAIRDTQNADNTSAQEAQDNAKRTQLTREKFLARARGDLSQYDKLQQDLANLETDIAARKLKESRQAEIDKLQIQKDGIRESASISEEAIREEIKARKKTEDEKNQATINSLSTVLEEQKKNINAQIENLRLFAEAEKASILANFEIKSNTLIAEREAFQEHYAAMNEAEAIEAEARRLILTDDQNALIELLSSYNPLWQNAGQTFGQKLLDGLNSMKVPLQGAIAEIMALVGKAKIPQTSSPMTLPGGAAGHGAIRGFATGGIVPGPLGAPQLAMVHGGETIIPPESNGGVVVNFSQPVFFDREDTMNRFVDLIRRGIQRQDRIRFGGAYSG